MAKETLNDTLTVRMSSKQLARFKKYCESKLKRPYQQMTREMIDALIDGRLRIQLTDTQKKTQEEIYEP